MNQVVLQLHTLPRLGAALFDPAQALLWTQRMARYAKPFRVALPNYGSRISLDTRGKIVGVESEVPVDLLSGKIREVFAAPTQVGAFRSVMEKTPLPSVHGVVWFRLPLDSDARTWTRSTWHSVIRRQPLETQMHAQWNHGTVPGTRGQLLLTNDGGIDAEFPESLVVNLPCNNGTDGAYSLEPAMKGSGSSVFFRLRKGLLRAGTTMEAATAVCTPGVQTTIVRIDR